MPFYPKRPCSLLPAAKTVLEERTAAPEQPPRKTAPSFFLTQGGAPLCLKEPCAFLPEMTARPFARKAAGRAPVQEPAPPLYIPRAPSFPRRSFPALPAPLPYTAPPLFFLSFPPPFPLKSRLPLLSFSLKNRRLTVSRAARASPPCAHFPRRTPLPRFLPRFERAGRANFSLSKKSKKIKKSAFIRLPFVKIFGIIYERRTEV